MSSKVTPGGASVGSPPALHVTYWSTIEALLQFEQEMDEWERRGIGPQWIGWARSELREEGLCYS